MRLKKFRSSKELLVKIFIYQQKNRLSLNVKLRKKDLALLCFLWKNSYILGFTQLVSNTYTIFLKKHFKQFSVNFIERKLSYKKLSLYNTCVSFTKTPIILSSNGLLSPTLITKRIGGLLLCDIF